jgi:hypothetical protein
MVNIGPSPEDICKEYDNLPFGTRGKSLSKASTENTIAPFGVVSETLNEYPLF